MTNPLDPQLARKLATINRGLHLYTEALNQGKARPSFCIDQRGEAVWHHGHGRLWRFAAENYQKAPVLLVPSMLNTADIFAMESPYLRAEAEHSHSGLIGFIRQQQRSAYVLTWSTEDDPTWDQLAQELGRAQQWIRAQHPHAPHVLGYCLGGTVAATVLLPPFQVAAPMASLTLLATPWDFHILPEISRHGHWLPYGCMSIPDIPQLSASTFSQGHVAACFQGIRPWASILRYEALANITDEQARERFIQIHHWACSCNEVSRFTARDIFAQLFVDNTPIAAPPSRIPIPALLVVGARDRLVPPLSSLAFLHRHPHSAVLSLPTGHLGALIGMKSRTTFYERLRQFWQDAETSPPPKTRRNKNRGIKSE